MRREQANYFNMAQAVIDHMENNTGVWQNNVLISTSYSNIKNLLEEIRNSSVKQSDGATKGYTDAKDHARENLEEQVFNLGLKLRAFAKLNRDEVLLAHFESLSPSNLYHMPFNNFITFAKLVEGYVKKYFSQLADFQVSEEDLSNLQMSLEEVPKLYAHRDEVMDERMASTSKLIELFAKLRKEMKLQDDLMAAFIDEREFLIIHMNSRRIHDLRRHTGKHEKQTDGQM